MNEIKQIESDEENTNRVEKAVKIVAQANKTGWQVKFLRRPEPHSELIFGGNLIQLFHIETSSLLSTRFDDTDQRF